MSGFDGMEFTPENDCLPPLGAEASANCCDGCDLPPTLGNPIRCDWERNEGTWLHQSCDINRGANR